MNKVRNSAELISRIAVAFWSMVFSGNNGCVSFIDEIARSSRCRILTICTACGLLVLVGSIPASAQVATTPSYSFGIVPQQAASRLASTWGPLLAKIARDSGVNLSFKTAPDIPTFYQRVESGEYDIAYLNPYQYISAHSQVGFEAIAKEKARKIQGIVVVKADSPIRVLENLKGVTVAFPSPQSFAASILPRAALRSKGIAIEAKNVGSHESVYLAVASGLLPAGGGIVRTLETMPPEIQASLRILWSTEKFTPHAIAIHPRVPAGHVDRLLRVMLALEDSEEGRGLLAAIGFNGIEVAKNSDWDDIRQLEITPAEALGK